MLRRIFRFFGKKKASTKRIGCETLSDCGCKDRSGSSSSLGLTSGLTFVRYEQPSPSAERHALPLPEDQNAPKMANTASPDDPSHSALNSSTKVETHSRSLAKTLPQCDAKIKLPEVASAVKEISENLPRRYHLVKTLGMGANSKVKLAHDIATGEAVAIKIIRPARYRPELREESVMPRLNHPNIVKWHRHGRSGGDLLIVTEHAGGGSLQDLLRAKGRLREDDAKKVFVQLVDAVRHCHKRNVVHGDLKLSNVLLAVDGTVKLADFGRSDEYVRAAVERDPRYLAPEVLRLKLPGPKSDVWALGVLLHEMVAGMPPFAGLFPGKVLRSISETRYVAPSGVSASCKELLEQLLVEDPGKRASLHAYAMVKWLQPLCSSRDAPRLDPDLIGEAKAKAGRNGPNCRSCALYRLMGRAACAFRHVREVGASP